MSHSLHRYGTKEDLKNDFCMYARCARGVNRDNPGDKLRKILDIYLSENYVITVPVMPAKALSMA